MDLLLNRDLLSEKEIQESIGVCAATCSNAIPPGGSDESHGVGHFQAPRVECCDGRGAAILKRSRLGIRSRGKNASRQTSWGQNMILTPAKVRK
jgi:hypothetical protein